MGKFNSIVLTNDGRELQNKAQIGAPLVFTRIGLGSGYLGESNLESLSGLIDERMSLDIINMKLIGDGTSSITAGLTNQSLEEGFYIREIGLYAQDSEHGEILYAVANSGDRADFLPKGTASEVVENTIEIITIVGNAENVTAVIDSSLVYATKAELDIVQASLGTSEEKLTLVEDSLSEMNLEIANIGGEITSLSQGLEGVNTKITDVEEEISSHLADNAAHGDIASRFRMNKDEESIFRVAEWKRPNGTLFKKSTLSGGATPQYEIRTVEYFNNNEEVIETIIYDQFYDEDGDWTHEVIRNA